MIFEEMPEKFNPRFVVVSCFLENDGKILLLHRQDHKPEGDTWGVPAGKIMKGEEIHDAIIREIEEETGMRVSSSQLDHFRKLYVKYPDYDFIYHIFHMKTENRNVSINPKEHKDFIWAFPKEALSMDLIQDLDGCIRLFYDV